MCEVTILPGLIGPLKGCEKPNSLAHHSIFDKKASNAMNVNEHFFRIGHYLAQIDNILNALGHICII